MAITLYPDSPASQYNAIDLVEIITKTDLPIVVPSFLNADRRSYFVNRRGQELLWGTVTFIPAIWGRKLISGFTQGQTPRQDALPS
jgi:hypothetical protein